MGFAVLKKTSVLQQSEMKIKNYGESLVKLTFLLFVPGSLKFFSTKVSHRRLCLPISWLLSASVANSLLLKSEVFVFNIIKHLINGELVIGSSEWVIKDKIQP